MIVIDDNAINNDEIATLASPKVNEQVATVFEHKNGYKQIPDFGCRLTKKFYLFPGISSSDDLSSSSAESGLSLLYSFTSKVAQHYLHGNAFIPCLSGDPQHIEDAWVPLIVHRVESDTKQSLLGNRTDQVKFQELLKSNLPESPISLIRGDTGTGKTTLVKKIAYDWAVNFNKNLTGPFRLVLAIPLASVKDDINNFSTSGSFDDFIILATDYFLKTFQHTVKLSPNLRLKLIKLLQDHLGPNLLVILDGLDEYGDLAESPFKSYFENPNSSADRENTSRHIYRPYHPVINFALLITARPYSFEKISWDSFPLRFELCPLDKDHWKSFAQLYCRSEATKKKIVDFIADCSNSYIIKTPLIFTFICYLADNEEGDITSNLTLLHESCIKLMISRETERLDEQIDMSKWKQSQLVTSIGELAFTNIETFSKETLSAYHVTNDSFICGFLVHNFDIWKQIRKIEFTHWCFRQFFSALHCYQLMFKETYSGATDFILHWQSDNLFGQFLLGICSRENNFKRMIEWMDLSFANSQIASDVNKLIHSTNEMLEDCSQDDQLFLGKYMHESIWQIGQVFIDEWDSLCETETFMISHGILLPKFAEGLNIQFWGQSDDWYICSTNHVKVARLIGLEEKSPKFLADQFEQIDVFMWNWLSFPSEDGVSKFAELAHLPLINFMWLQVSDMNCLTFEITYDYDVLDSENQLIVFKFSFNLEDRKSICDLVDRGVDDNISLSKFRSCTIGYNDSFYGLLHVTVKEYVSQFTLIESLIVLAMDAIKHPAGSQFWE